MKKILAVAILSGISFSAQAAEKMYVAAGVGTASNFGTAFSVAGGMEVASLPMANKNVPISAEVGYQSFGSKDFGAGVSVSATAFYGAVAGSFALSDELAATAKLGLASVSAEAAIPQYCVLGTCYGGGKATSSSMETLFGIGINYDLKKAMKMPLSVGAEYTDFGGESVIGARVTMKF